MKNEYRSVRLGVVGSDGVARRADQRAEPAEKRAASDNAGPAGGRDYGAIRNREQLLNALRADSSDIWGGRTRSRADSHVGGNSVYWPAPVDPAIPSYSAKRREVKRRSDDLPVLKGSLLVALAIFVVLLIALALV